MARKAKERREKRAAGDADALKFGRTKEQVALEKAQAQKAAKLLDGHKRSE